MTFIYEYLIVNCILIEIIDINNPKRKIKLDLIDHQLSINPHIRYTGDIYCNINLKSELVLYGYNRYIYIYSTKTKSDVWDCKRLYMITDGSKLISILKYDKAYFYKDNYIYEFNTFTRDSESILSVNDNDEIKEISDTKVSSDEKFTCLKINNKIKIYSNELKIHIASVNINNDEELFGLFNLMKQIDISYTLLFSLFTNTKIWNSILKFCWNESSNRLNVENLPILFDNIKTNTKYLFCFINGHVHKIPFEENKFHLLTNSDKLNSNNGDDEKILTNEEMKENNYHQLNIRLFNVDMSIIRKLFHKVNNKELKFKSYKSEYEIDQWEIKIDDDEKQIELKVYKNGSSYTRIENCYNIINNITSNKKVYLFPNFWYGKDIRIITGEIFNNNDIIVLTTIGIFIYHLNEHTESITLDYFYFIYYYKKLYDRKNYDDKKFQKTLQKIEKFILKSNHLPLPNHDSFISFL